MPVFGFLAQSLLDTFSVALASQLERSAQHAESEAMDLKTYEHAKFELAELIRSGRLIASEGETNPNKRHEAEHPWRLLLTRLAEDRFTVVVAGRFSRGKSSLMNAVLGMDRLPTGSRVCA